MDNIRRSGIAVIFSEHYSSNKIMDSIAADLGLRMYSLDTLGTGDLGPGWYISRMRENLETLNNALGAKWTR
jgi:ABC-type Zn uptake system ZnuABC Zn-binding protein ZnuA